ncbi:MAG: hypothetical protein A2Y30_09875 [Spirochaetes bacterium GWE1_32_154]|nr:MAG: hypothetical protein A2Y30_09875 [Spirochaetes bacterium GWE1_32_154]
MIKMNWQKIVESSFIWISNYIGRVGVPALPVFISGQKRGIMNGRALTQTQVVLNQATITESIQ